MNWVYILVTLTTAIVLTGLVRRYAIKHSILDIPNERSSHMTSVPRGGGVAIASAFLAALTLSLAIGDISLRLYFALAFSGLAIAIVGFFDDRRGMRISVRLAVHVFAACMFLALLGNDISLKLGNLIVDNRIVLLAFAALYLIWMLNLFNFMDGIDGIAGVEAVTTAIGAGALLCVAGNGALSYICFALAAACAGFLTWNWPPAKIFMGDVGSGFLGFTLAAISLLAHVSGTLEIWVWLILMGVFVVDATVTLLTRMIRGEKWTSAHRSHAYQKAARRFDSHLAVTSIVLLINLLWLFPLAFAAAIMPQGGWWLTIMAWTPLAAVALILKAGQVESSVANNRM